MKKRNRKTKDNLIPISQSRKIIKLERRGKQKRKWMSAAVCGVLAALCMVYCLDIYFFMGYGTKFFLIWGAMSVVLAVMSFLLCHPAILERIPKFIRVTFGCCVAAGIIVFIIVEGMILSHFKEAASPGADYLIVLGAQWKNNGPSYVLQKRLDKAVIYLNDNPDTYVIVSGGQGRNEPISEAEGMAGYLENAGIDPDRIIKEDRSTDTNQNLEFSAVYLDKAEDRVVIVTNNFHVFRSVSIARKKGYHNVEGLAADSYTAMLPNNLLREFFGVVKDIFIGNM